MATNQLPTNQLPIIQYATNPFYKIVPYSDLTRLGCHFTKESKECTICMNELMNENVALLSCYHLFHIDCINDWINMDFRNFLTKKEKLRLAIQPYIDTAEFPSQLSIDYNFVCPQKNTYTNPQGNDNNHDGKCLKYIRTGRKEYEESKEFKEAKEPDELFHSREPEESFHSEPLTFTLYGRVNLLDEREIQKISVFPPQFGPPPPSGPPTNEHFYDLKLKLEELIGKNEFVVERITIPWFLFFGKFDNFDYLHRDSDGFPIPIPASHDIRRFYLYAGRIPTDNDFERKCKKENKDECVRELIRIGNINGLTRLLSGKSRDNPPSNPLDTQRDNPRVAVISVGNNIYMLRIQQKSRGWFFGGKKHNNKHTKSRRKVKRFRKNTRRHIRK